MSKHLAELELLESYLLEIKDRMNIMSDIRNNNCIEDSDFHSLEEKVKDKISKIECLAEDVNRLWRKIYS